VASVLFTPQRRAVLSMLFQLLLSAEVKRLLMNSLAYSSMSLVNTYSMPSYRPVTASDDQKAIKSSALRHLAHREYSRLELFRKLSLRFSSGENIQAVLLQLKDQGYQSDDRFTEMFIRTKVRAGNGPFKIKIELREKGICESTALAIFDRLAIDWFEQIKMVAKKYFNEDAEAPGEIDLNVLSKRIRYLKNKGFYQEHIEKVVKL
jgi:regulatory protein